MVATATLEPALAEYHRLGVELKAKEDRRAQLREQLIGAVAPGKWRFGAWDLDLTVYPERRTSFDREAAEAALGVSLEPWTTTTTTDKTRLTVKPTPAAAVAILPG